MSPITFPFQGIPTIISLVAVGLIVAYRHRLFANSSAKSFWTATLSFCLIYALIVGGAAVDNVYRHWDLNQYDLNGDGMFSGTEQTEGQIMAMDRLINDTGRTLAPISGAFFAFVLALATYIISRGFEKYKRLKAEE